MAIQKQTKIVCTLGPVSGTEKVIVELVKSGMNIARLNFSHGTHIEHKTMIKTIRKVEKKTGEPIGIMADLQGPKIRVGQLPDKGIKLAAGEKIKFDSSVAVYRNKIVPIDYDLGKYVKTGEKILLDDGQMEVKVTVVRGNLLEGEVVVGGVLTSHKGINVPTSDLPGASLTEKDRADLALAVEQGVDLVALSFVAGAKDILDLRFLIKKFEKEMKLAPEKPIMIVAKIERAAAVKNSKEIIEVADALMVARGDLGIEIPAQKVPLTQKSLISLALAQKKPVIVATQMLESMRYNPRPTRAEVSDIANAVIDHADAVMLSAETASGKYPVESVKLMAEIIQETEKSVYDDLPVEKAKSKKNKLDDIISGLSRELAELVGAKLILAASISGDTARLISHYRPELPIIIGTYTDRVRRQMNLSWGVIPFILERCSSIEELIGRSISYLKKKKLVAVGDKIIVVAGEPIGEPGNINLLEVREV